MIHYRAKHFLADLVLLAVLALMGGGIFYVLKPSLAKLRVALIQRRPPAAAPLAAGTPADYGWSVQDLEGNTIPMAALKGKVVFLNFWATWCGPCLLELPSIEKLYEGFKDADVVFVSVSDEEPAVLKAFAQKSKSRIPIYAVRQIPEFFNVSGLPTTFILSRSGKVALSRVGAAAWNKKKVVELLKALLAEPPSLTSP